MIFEEKIIDIIDTMIDYGMLAKDKLDDVNYVTEQVKLYLEARKFVFDNFKSLF